MSHYPINLNTAKTNMTQIARIVALDVDDDRRRVVLLCGLDHEFRLVEGEWMGYASNPAARMPFILTSGRLEYADGPETHNFGSRPIVPDELFTVGDEDGGAQATYRIRSVSFYQPLD